MSASVSVVAFPRLVIFCEFMETEAVGACNWSMVVLLLRYRESALDSLTASVEFTGAFKLVIACPLKSRSPVIAPPAFASFPSI